MARKFLQVDPRTLRLPSTRLQGADLWKLQRQIALHGNSTTGMPVVVVERDKNGVLMIMDGVTRATRVAKLLPGQVITVEVSRDWPNSDFSHLPIIGDVLP